MFNDVIELVTEVTSTNEYGDVTTTETRKAVFCKVKSVGMKEKYQALAVGLSPELVFVLADYYDYNNEQRIIYQDTTYDVIRTYRTGISLEVVVSHGNSE